MQRALHLGDELLGAAAQHERARLGLGAVLEEVEALAADLALVKSAAGAEVLGVDVGARALDGGSRGLDDALHVVAGYAAGAEDVAVGKVLGGEVADGELGQDHLGARRVDGLELLEDDLPLGVDDGLVLRDLLDAHLGIVLFGLELELDVEADDLGLLERLGLLLEAGVGKRLFEGDAVDEEGVGEGAAGYLFDAYEVLVEVFLIEGEDGVDDHWKVLAGIREGGQGEEPTLCEELGVALDQLAGHGCPGELAERFPPVRLVGDDGDFLDLVDGHLGSSPETLDDDL